MLDFNLIDIIGYSATILLVISFALQYNATIMRVVNTVACILFVVYGVIKNAYPVAIANAIIVMLNIFYQYKTMKKNNV